MNFRFGTVLVLAGLFFVVGCASTPETRAPSTVVTGGDPETDELPDWINELPAGVEPRDNEHTAQATLYLGTAMAAGTDELRLSRYETALEHARAGLAADPDNPQSHFQAGEALLSLGRLEEAAPFLDRAEELYPRYILETLGVRETAWIEEYNAGVEYLDAGDTQNAMARFERANMIYSLRPEAMLNLGTVYAQVGRYEDSQQQFANAIEVIEGPWAERVDEEVSEGWFGVLAPTKMNRAQVLLRLERFSDAADVLGELVAADPENLDYVTTYASALVAGGRADQAQALFDDLLGRDGLDAADFLTVGVGLYQVEQYEGAARAFQRAFEIVPNHRDIAFNLSQTLYLNQDWEGLVTSTTKLLEIDELNPMAYRFRANALLELGREPEAMEVYETGQNLPVTVDDLTLRAAGNDVVLVGQATNHGVEGGHQLRLRFTFYDLTGASVGSREETIRFSAQGEARTFQVEAPGGSVFGFSYEVMG
jgi:tetratricopeptide (TPR) repeat protein